MLQKSGRSDNRYSQLSNNNYNYFGYLFNAIVQVLGEGGGSGKMQSNQTRLFSKKLRTQISSDIIETFKYL